jgi:hypothetical protein
MSESGWIRSLPVLNPTSPGLTSIFCTRWSRGYSRAVPKFPMFQRRSLSTSINVDGADRCKVLFGAIIYEVPGVVCHTPEKASTLRCEWPIPNQINMPVLTECIHIQGSVRHERSLSSKPPGREQQIWGVLGYRAWYRIVRDRLAQAVLPCSARGKEKHSILYPAQCVSRT